MRRKILLSLVIFIVVGLAGLQLYVSHRLATVGQDLKKMQGKIEDMKLENELLKSEIATSSSLTTITQKADSYGFKSATYIYLEKPPVALNQ